MASYNKVILIGNLTRDPELRYTQKGTAIAKIGIAVNRVWRDEAGAQHEEVTFVDVESFGKQAETLGQYMKKGRPIMVEGRLKLDTWEDKQTNQKRSRMVVVLESFQFLDFGGRPADEPGAPPPSRPAASAPPAQAAPSSSRPAPPAPPPGPPDEMPAEEDDVPF
jgi:single-strand DNA-binding protein